MTSDEYSRRIGTKCEQNPHGPQISVPHGWARGGVRRPRALALGRPAVENCGLRWRRNRRGGSTQPPQGAWQTKPATFSCRAFCAVSTHGRWPRPRGVGARHGRQLKTAAFGCETAGGGWVQPPQGGLETKPATSSCRAFCAISSHGRWPRPRALVPTRPAVENCGLRWGETAGGGSVQPPLGGLANEARNV